MDNYKFCPQCATQLVEKIIDQEKIKACPKCDFIFWNNPKPAVSMLILNNQKEVLMIQRAKEPLKDYWVLPGGFMKANETPQNAVLREVKEETGLSPELNGIFGAYRIDNDPRGIHVDIVYSGLSNETIKLSSEDKNWRYFSKDNLPDKIAWKHREAITDWYNRKNE